MIAIYLFSLPLQLHHYNFLYYQLSKNFCRLLKTLLNLSSLLSSHYSLPSTLSKRLSTTRLFVELVSVSSVFISFFNFREQQLSFSTVPSTLFLLLCSFHPFYLINLRLSYTFQLWDQFYLFSTLLLYSTFASFSKPAY